jgi:hypothetical protein
METKHPFDGRGLPIKTSDEKPAEPIASENSPPFAVGDVVTLNGTDATAKVDEVEWCGHLQIPRWRLHVTRRERPFKQAKWDARFCQLLAHYPSDDVQLAASSDPVRSALQSLCDAGHWHCPALPSSSEVKLWDAAKKALEEYSHERENGEAYARELDSAAEIITRMGFGRTIGRRQVAAALAEMELAQLYPKNREALDAAKFTLTWRDGEYRVSKPDVGTMDVVSAEAYANLLDELAKAKDQRNEMLYEADSADCDLLLGVGGELFGRDGDGRPVDLKRILDEVKRLKEFEREHGRRFVCVYCGQVSPPNLTRSDALLAVALHSANCPEHPIHMANVKAAEAERELRELREQLGVARL